MTLSSYIPELVGADFAALTNRQLALHTGWHFTRAGNALVYTSRGQKDTRSCGGKSAIAQRCLASLCRCVEKLRKYVFSYDTLRVEKADATNGSCSAEGNKCKGVWCSLWARDLTMETFVGRAVCE